MKGDFSRIRFDPVNRYSRVLQQQGRVTLDADGNEQVDILLHYLRTLARDLIGEYGGPDGSFELSIEEGNEGTALKISAGHYYVHGILCENAGCDYANQPDYKPRHPGESGDDDLLKFLKSRGQGDDCFWVYLDVWERHITALEEPGLREVALGGPDTCTRSKVIWQVKARALAEVKLALQARETKLSDRISAIKAEHGDTSVLGARLERVQDAIRQLDDDPDCAAPLEAFGGDAGGLCAQLEKEVQPGPPGILVPDARYRGFENHLYRIEIHHGGTANEATFKWSRDNGSIATSWLGLDDDKLRAGSTRGFRAGMWVELSDDSRELACVPGALARLLKVDEDGLAVDMASMTDFDASKPLTFPSAPHPKVRAWDQRGDDLGNGLPLLVGGDSAWLDLEDGIQVRFAIDGNYHSGDYWLIPARVAVGAEGGIDWPSDSYGEPQQQPPRGVEHHYAPLGFLKWTTKGVEVSRCLRTLNALASCQAGAVRDLAKPNHAPVMKPIEDQKRTKPRAKPRNEIP